MKLINVSAVGGAGLSLVLALGAGAALADRPSAISSVCLDGGRSAETCACAEEKLVSMLPPAAYADYQAVAEMRLADPSRNPTLTDAAQTVANERGMELDALRSSLKNAVEMHRQTMRECN